MTVLIIIFGALTFLTGMVFLMNPDFICGFLQRQLGKVGLHVLNVVVRILFGVVMISQSGTSKFPFVIETIGWFCIVLAVILTLMGRKNFDRIITWAVSLLQTSNRIAGVLIMTFGAFLISAFV